MQYKMVFSDIDGTLLDSAHRISSDTGQKIRELSQRGVPFILVSARMPSGIFPIQRALDVKAPIVCYSGALVLNEHGEALTSAGLDREKALEIEAYIKNEWQQVCCSAFSFHDWIVDDIRNEWIAEEQRITGSVPKEGALSRLVPANGQIHKFLCMGEAKVIAALGAALEARFSGLSVYRSKDTYLEIMNGNASKSAAVRVLCALLEIPIEETVSFGDNFNDLDMLLATGLGFAMGNAPSEVKRQVRHVIPDNDHEGLLAGLEQLDFTDRRN